MRIWEKLFVAVTLFAVTSAAALYVYWALIDTDPPLRHLSVATLDGQGRPTKIFHRGEVMVLARESCILREFFASYTRAFVERTKRYVYFISPSQMRLSKGCRKAFHQVIVPPYMEPGVYDYIVVVAFENNPLFSGALTLPVPEVTIK